MFFSPNKKIGENLQQKIIVRKKSCRKIGKLPVLEEPWFFGRNRQMRLEQWPPKFWFSGLYNFWQGGKRDGSNFWWRLWAKSDFRKQSIYEITKLWCSVASWLEDAYVQARRLICPALKTGKWNREMPTPKNYGTQLGSRSWNDRDELWPDPELIRLLEYARTYVHT